MSMNIQLLSINSADPSWTPAFVDISPTKVILRKLIEVTNLTICLDKRNETGKIEMCQEPILYRCSMKLKMLKRYNATTSHKASLLKVDLHSESMHINISSVQFPMVMRLFNLMQALKDGSLEKRLISGGISHGGGVDGSESINQDGEGLISWAWNLLPTIFPDDNTSDSSDNLSDHITHFGYKIDNIQITVKDLEPLSESHNKKLKFQPLCQLNLDKCQGQSIGVGKRWSTFQGSVARIEMIPLAKCVCGQKQTIEYFIKSKDVIETNDKEMETSEPQKEMDLYSTNWDDYFVTQSWPSLHSQRAAIVLDICYSLEVPDDSSARLSEVGSDLEQSGLRERHLMRVMCNNLQFKYGPSVTHLVETLKSYSNQYNYPPYLEVKPIPQFNQLTPPSSDDYEALMAEVPLRKYELQMSRTSVEFVLGDHKTTTERRKLEQVTVVCNFKWSELKYATPFYPNRLVFTTCQLPQRPMKLFEACYQRMGVSLKEVELLLGEKEIVNIPIIEGYSRSILHPHLWLDANVLTRDLDLDVPELRVRNIGEGVIAKINDIYCEANAVKRKDPSEDIQFALQITLRGLKVIKFQTRHTMVQQVKILQLNGGLTNGNEFLKSHFYKDSANLLDFLLQTPLDEKDQVNPAIVMLNLGEIEFMLNNQLLQLINLIELRPNEHKSGIKDTSRKVSVADESTKSVTNKSISGQKQKEQSKDQRSLLQRSNSGALESVHSSSEKNATVVVVENVQKDDNAVKGANWNDLFDRYKSKIISCDLKTITLLLDFTSGKCVQRIRLPEIIMNTTGGRVGELKRKVPISNEALDIVNKERFFFPWSFQLVGASCEIETGGRVFTVLEKWRSNVTLVVNEKVVEEKETEKAKEDGDGKTLKGHPLTLEIVIHVDTSPIVVNLTEMAINFLCLNVKTLEGLYLTKEREKNAINTIPIDQQDQIEIAKRPISPDSSFDLRKLFDSSATDPKTIKDQDESLTDITELQEVRRSTDRLPPSLWMQLALEKFNINMFTNAEREKFCLKTEDVICSWDRKDEAAYSKLKVKVGAISGKLMNTETTEKELWIIDESLSFSGRNNEPSNVAFIDLTVTRAGTGVVHSKWGVHKKKQRYMNEDLVEIMLKVQHLDVKLDVVKLSEYVKVFDGVRGEKREKRTISKKPDRVTSVVDLPLVFFESKGIHLHLPVTLDDGSAQVFVLKVPEITINPTVENPLTRNPVRADIYTKATQLGIVNLPGSRIEDRQYQLQFRKMSLETADWNEMVCYLSRLGSGYENPAVVWNNPIKDRTMEIVEVFKNFHCSFVWAPAIVFNNVLVCGPSVELSCVSDLKLAIRTDQCKTALQLNKAIDEMSNADVNRRGLKEMARIFTDKSMYQILRERTKCKKPKKIVFASATGDEHNKTTLETGSRKSDSGISSMRVTKKLSTTVISNKDYQMNVPYDVTFLGGNFYVDIFSKKSIEVPIVKLLLYQPNLTFTQSVYDQTVNMGLFNITLQLPTDDGESVDEVFNTHQGKLNALGIPPSVLRVKFTESVTRERMLIANLFRPIHIKTNGRLIEKLQSLNDCMSEIIPVEPLVYRSIPEIVPRNWIQSLKLKFLDSTKISFSITQLEIGYNHSERHSLSMIVSHLSTNCLVQSRPERVTVELQIKGVALKTDELVLLHPTHLQLTTILTKEFWQRNPVITVSGGFNYLQVDIGPKNLICLREIAKSLNNNSSTIQTEKLPVDRCKKAIFQNDLISMDTPKPCIDVKEEFYQDDLRAGAFQFVEIATDRHLPLSYQIQVINRRDNRIICWKYPQARALHNVEILPVPFNIVSTAVVKCYIEFYSDSRGEFMAYSEFCLSESQRQILKLPKKRITASVWRVVMKTPTVEVNGKFFQEEDEEGTMAEDDMEAVKRENENVPLIYNINDILQTAEDDEGMDDSQNDDLSTLHPKILIACMKVDSYFNPALIPNCTVFVHVNQLEVNIMNQLVGQEECKLPDALKTYRGPCNVLPINQHVAQIRVDNCKIGTSIYDDLNLDLQWQLGVQVNLADFACSRAMPFVEHFQFSGYYDCGDEEKERILNLLVRNSLKVHVDPSVVHTIFTAMSIWNQGLTNGGEQGKELILMTRFVICNSTSTVIYYGQKGADELYPVLPRGFDFYAFKSVNAQQALFVAMDSETGRVTSEAFIISEDQAEQCIRMGNSFLVITVKSLSSTQRMVTVRGQMEVFNLSREKFVLQLGSEAEKRPMMLLDKCMSIVSQRNLEELNVLRVCFENIGHWSGDVPIRASGKRLPWLVKVPVAKGKYLSYWIRVAKCPIQIGEEMYSRYVVIILPLYFIRSYLPQDTIVEELKLQKTCQVFGKGALNELHLMGTHDDEHLLKFSGNFKTITGQDRSEILLSYKAMDVGKLFPDIDEVVNCSRLVQAFEKFSYESCDWPMKEDAKIQRNFSEPDHFVPLCDFGSLMVPEEKFFNSLVLELSAWSVFINASGMRMVLKSNKRSMLVEANYLATPFDFLDNRFIVQFEADNGVYVDSPEIFMGGKNDAGGKEVLVLNEGDPLTLEVPSVDGKYLLRMIISLKRIRNRKVITVASQYVAVNYTQLDVSIFMIAVPQTVDKNMFFSLGLFPNPDVGSYRLSGRKDSNGNTVRGSALSTINNELIVSQKKKAKKMDAKCLYLMVATGEGDSLCPVNITEPFARKSLNLTGKNKRPISLIISMIKENDQYFLTVVEDPSPDIEIFNKTNENLCIGQSESAAKLIGPVKECDHFQWFSMVPGKSFVNYSPPGIYKNYPQLTTNNSSWGLSLAVSALDGSPLKWCQPFAVTEGEVYLTLPGKSDVKVIVSGERRTTTITIETVNANEEFSLKNVRSRLLHPIAEEEEEEEETDQIENAMTPQIETADQKIVEVQPVKIQLTLFVKEFGLFVATEQKDRSWIKENIVSLTVDDVLVEYSSEKRQLQVETGNIQIDNQLSHTGCFDFPVLFCADSELSPREIPSSVFYLNDIVERQEASPLLNVAVKLYQQEMAIEELECSIRPIRLYLEDTYLSRLGDAITEFVPQSAVYASEREEKVEVLVTGDEVVVPKHLESVVRGLAQPVKMNAFKIGHVDVLISLHTSTRFYIALDHSPLSFSAFERVNLRTTEMKLGSSMSMHYLSGAIFGAGWMVGSLEILGSPSGLARSVTMGLRDFVSKPVEGLFKGPWEFMTGVTSGSLSLVRNITAGTVNSVTKLATSVARNLDRLTLDEDHVKRTDLVRRVRPHGVTEGFAQGLTQFGITLLGAVGGISRHTMAAKTPGQVLSGVGKGLMGVILKPISGAAELVAYTGED